MEELSNFILVDDIIKDDNWNVTIIFILVKKVSIKNVLSSLPITQPKDGGDNCKRCLVAKFKEHEQTLSKYVQPRTFHLSSNTS